MMRDSWRVYKRRFYTASSHHSASAVTVFLSLLLSACSTVQYYSHLAKGQWSLWSQRQSISSLLKQDDLDASLRDRLVTVQQVRQFATDELALADNQSYRHYTDLQRPFAVWNVFAAAEFSTIPMNWCFPFAGCVSYRGYFSERAATGFAQQLAAQGMDIYVAGVAAYSTLGWFDDPVLNTFLHNDDTRLAGLIFHELAHQQVYVPGETQFNESFARCVEVVGIKRWLQAQQQSPQIEQYLQRLRMQQHFVEIVLALQADLAALYQQPLAEHYMREQKQQRIREFVRLQYSRFKTQWNGYNGYDNWVMGKHSAGLADDAAQASVVINNAKLSTIASYHRWVPAFEQLLEDSAGDLTQFYQQVKQLATLESSARLDALQQLHQRATLQVSSR